MPAAVFTKTIGDRWRGWVIATLSLAGLFLGAMAAYRSIDLGIYTELPEAFRSIIGIPEAADVGSLSINLLVSSYGAITIAALALAMGSAAIAVEERDGTIGLLLANPKSRTHVLVSKAAAMMVLTAFGVLALWGAIVLSARLLDVSIEGMHVGALSLHLLVSSLFYGFLATAAGAWTGNRGTAVGVAVGVMLVSFFAVGVLPLLEAGEDFVKAFPWHYFDGSDPLLNGVEWSHVGLLAACSAVFVTATVVGVNRRDLKGQSVGVTLLDRLRAHPMTEKAVGRLAGAARVSDIWVKTASEYQGLLLIVAAYGFLVQGVLMGPLYAAMPTEAFQAVESFPEAMIALFGGGDISTPEGFYQLETFGMMAPVVVMIVAIAIGAGALAGEESRRTMGLLLANPLKRSRIVLEKAWVMIIFSFFIGLITFAGVALGSLLGDLGMNMGNIAATCLLQILVGLVFGALALALSAGTGRTMVAVFGSAGAGLVFHVVNGFAELNDTLAGVARWSPFHYYLSSDPLMNGMNWGHGAILAALAAGLIALSVVLFERRDIRQRG